MELAVGIATIISTVAALVAMVYAGLTYHRQARTASPHATAGEGPAQTSRQFDWKLLSLGVVCVLGAITAGTIKIFGLELPAVSSIPRQVLLAMVGFASIVASFLVRPRPEQPSAPQADSQEASPAGELSEGTGSRAAEVTESVGLISRSIEQRGETERTPRQTWSSGEMEPAYRLEYSLKAINAYVPEAERGKYVGEVMQEFIKTVWRPS